MNSLDIFRDIEPQLQAVEQELLNSITTDVPVLKEASVHLVKAGGKRLRPAFVLLSGSFYCSTLDSLIPLAVALELVHVATLVHDDVIDNSLTRRGQETVKARWGNRISLYSGNYILARSLCLIATYDRADIIDILATVSMKVCEGEIIQMLTCYDVGQSYKDYLRRIERKTALLMALSCQSGALVGGAPADKVRALKRFGYYLGMAFQITDDVLDFVASEEVLGKPVGSDIRQGIITLPALYALRESEEKEVLASILSSPEKCVHEAEKAISIVLSSGGIDFALEVAKSYAEKARSLLRSLPEACAKSVLDKIAEFVVTRDF